MSAHNRLPEESTIGHAKDSTLSAKQSDLINELVTDDMDRIFYVQSPHSILPLQVIMHFDIIYSVFYSIFLLLISIYKVLGGLLYPANIWELEFATIIFFFMIQVFRLYFGYHANRTEHTFSMALFFGATAFSTLFFIYFSFLTTYVLLIELIVGVIGIFFGVVEMILALAATIIFHKAN